MELSRSKTYKFSYDEDGNETPKLKWIGKEGNWNQFVKDDGKVWSELLDSDLWILTEVNP